MIVPGCPGGEEEMSRTDFCVDPTNLVQKAEETAEDPDIVEEMEGPTISMAMETPDPTSEPTDAATMGTTESMLPPILTVGNDGVPEDVYPLGLCQGELCSFPKVYFFVLFRSQCIFFLHFFTMDVLRRM